MNIKALITSLVLLGSTSAAMASPGFSYQVGGSISVGGPVVRDHRTPANDLPIIIASNDRMPDRYGSWNRGYDRGYERQQFFTISGTYESEFGQVTLTQRGDRVFGSYKGGTIEGRIIDGQIHYRFFEHASEGRGVFTVTGRNQLQGNWWYTTASKRGTAGVWTLSRC